MRVEHRICSTICGTPVQAIWDHKDLTELALGVREGQNLPQNSLNLALEPSRGPQIGQWPLKWIQNGSPNCPWLIWVYFLTFKSIAAFIFIKKHQLSLIVKSIDFWNVNFHRFNRPNVPFWGDILIFLSLPHDGWLRKIEISWKKCIVWSVEAVKVTCIFFTEFWVKNFETFWNF